jgi:hypothetical protein
LGARFLLAHAFARRLLFRIHRIRTRRERSEEKGGDTATPIERCGPRTFGE